MREDDLNDVIRVHHLSLKFFDQTPHVFRNIFTKVESEGNESKKDSCKDWVLRVGN